LLCYPVLAVTARCQCRSGPDGRLAQVDRLERVLQPVSSDVHRGRDAPEQRRPPL